MAVGSRISSYIPGLTRSVSMFSRVVQLEWQTRLLAARLAILRPRGDDGVVGGLSCTLREGFLRRTVHQGAGDY